MPIRDILAAALSRPAGRVVDGPVRDIVNEILADHGYASPAELAALKAETDGLKKTLKAATDRLAALEASAAALSDTVAEIQARPAAAAPLAGPRPSLIPDVPAPPEQALSERTAWVERSIKRGSCKVLDCTESTHRDGFCVAHGGDWQAGRLAGFISPEGLVSISGAPMLVDPSLAGQAYAVESGLVQVRGRVVPAVGY